jgi:large repetitive protein
VTAVHDAAATAQNTAVVTRVAANDTADGAPLNPASVRVTVQPAHGRATVDRTTGAITYTPAANYSGADSYTYSICDRSTPTPVCATATVSVTVGPDVVTARNDTATTVAGSAVVTPVLGNDTVSTHGAPLRPSSVTVTVAPAHGTTIVNARTGAITFTPTAGFTGTDVYTYRVCDTSTPTPVCDTATVTVTVTAPPPGSLHVTKTGRLADGETGVAGDHITWRIRVTNTGAGPVSVLTVTDHGVASVDCPATTLAAGASLTCTTAVHVVTAGEARDGEAVNTATAGASDAAGNPVDGNSATAAVQLATPVDGSGGNGSGGNGTGGEGASRGSGGSGGGGSGGSSSGGSTAYTGVEIGGLLGLALAVLVAGLLFVLAGRRRRRDSAR